MSMNKIIAIAALITIVLAAYGASASPYGNSNFPNDYGHAQSSDRK
jgi:hypothetical protein